MHRPGARSRRRTRARSRPALRPAGGRRARRPVAWRGHVAEHDRRPAPPSRSASSACTSGSRKSPCSSSTPAIGLDCASRSTATTRQPRLTAYWLQLPGAAPRSTTRAPRCSRLKRRVELLELEHRPRPPALLAGLLDERIVELPLQPALRRRRCARARSSAGSSASARAGHASTSARSSAWRRIAPSARSGCPRAGRGRPPGAARPASSDAPRRGWHSRPPPGRRGRRPMQGCAARPASSRSRSSRDTVWMTANGSDMPSTLRRS